MGSSVIRAAVFILVGVAFFSHWWFARPSFEASPTQNEWPHVLAFSAVILGLAFGVPLFSRLVGGSLAFRTSLVAAAGSVLSSIANVIEDGLSFEWAFYGFVLGTAIMLLGLLTLTIVIARGREQRHFALVPAGTMAGILFYVIAGGPILLATWLAAAALALAPIFTGAKTAPSKL
jgi:hypothetical protein